MRGQGVGQLLVKQVVEFARAKEIKITPLCPFPRSQFERHEDYADVLLKKAGSLFLYEAMNRVGGDG
ncbi:GNAT family N-acetyltransferase [Paenibacillus sp. FSL H7-0331]|uniref:GNAT family N-acetyltransferase n=1 Tax=Paenibacillus sp. FSL H7-0331 TaxID=1920421 RepID=UPI002115E6B9|nr:GNAT family N-acetyltransferase [Paenibacillus sp. FSL H7-0331]